MVHRKKIPTLSSRNMHISNQGRLSRSFSVTPGDYSRMYQGDQMVLQVGFLEEHPSAEMVLHTNIDQPDGTFRDLPFKKIDKFHYRITVTPRHCGVFIFKVKYSLDKGKSWFWDRVPFSSLIVDPATLKTVSLYTLLPTVSGTVEEWKKRLVTIKEMGFNTVHLLPVTQMGGSESPYSAINLFALDPSFLNATKEDPSGLDAFESFVEEAKRLDLRLCIDLVLNHVGVGSHIAELCPEWIVPDKNMPDGFKRPGCWHMNHWISWDDLLRIHYDHPHQEIRDDIWNYMQSYALFWAHYAAYTGGMVRLDNLHSSDESFIKDLIKKLRQEYPTLIVQAEFFTDSNTLMTKVLELNLNAVLGNPWEHGYAYQLRNYLDYVHSVYDQIRFLLPVTTHDTGSPAQLFGSPKAAIPRFFVMALMGTGQTGIVQGTETGAPSRINFITRGGTPSSTPGIDLHTAFAAMNGLLHRYQQFHQGKNIQFIDGSHGAIIGALRTDKEGVEDDMLLLACFDTEQSHTLEINMELLTPPGKSMPEWLFGELGESTIPCTTAWRTFTLPPCGVQAYRIVRAE